MGPREVPQERAITVPSPGHLSRLGCGLVLILVIGLCPSCERRGPVSCEAGRQGCECFKSQCDAGLSCLWGRCYGEGQARPDTYYYTARARKDTDDIKHILGRLLDLKPGHHAADIGCGTGTMTTWMAEQVGPAGEIHATDISADALKATEQQRANVRHAAPVRTHLASHPRATGLEELASQSLDLIVMVNSVYFERHGEREVDVLYLRALRELLKPSGRLLYHFDWLPPHQLSRDETLELFKDAGFLGEVSFLAMPRHIPKQTTVYPEGVARDPLTLERGFIVMIHRGM